MNPILPVQFFIPDSEARQWKDGRTYIYGSYDICGGTSYCSYEYHSFSSKDLIEWTHHGCIFKSHGLDSDVPWSEYPLYAPDCIYNNGKYYLYFCMGDNSEGVAESDKPYGPFTNARKIEGPNGDAIDPAIFIDDDGKVYYYWGQFNARGVKMLPTMDKIDKSSLNESLINESDHGFHEGASMRKRGDYYYLVFADISRGKPTALGYAMSKSPLGPFEKKGIIVDNNGCDKSTWNNHGSIAEINGEWYVFYHRSSGDSNYSRRACIEPIFFDKDGLIDEVEMTTQGIQGPLDPSEWMEAYRACLISGNVRTVQTSVSIDRTKLVYEYLSHIIDKDWSAYKYFDFKENYTQFECEVASGSYGGTIVIHEDGPSGRVLGKCPIKSSEGWEDWYTTSCDISEIISGVHSIYLEFIGLDNRLFSLKRFRFK